tara:strand:+ start:3610 stop:3750 length:141 start_codon:yes stop_codon:yes gene_type:complete
MGDENTLATGTVAHKHELASSSGGSLSVPDTLIGGMPLSNYILVMG